MSVAHGTYDVSTLISGTMLQEISDEDNKVGNDEMPTPARIGGSSLTFEEEPINSLVIVYCMKKTTHPIMTDG